MTQSTTLTPPPFTGTIARPALPAWVALAGLLTLAAALRLVGLGTAPLWCDEAATAGFAALPWPALLTGIGRLEPNPPGFYAIEHLWTALAGTSAFALRLPSALCGIAAAGAVYALAQRILGRRPALWAALLVAVHPQQLEFAREARTYAALTLAVALAMLAATRLRESRRPIWIAALALCAAAAVALHHTGAVAIAAVFAAAAVTALRRPDPAARVAPLARLAVAAAATALLAAPALLQMAAIAADPANNAAWIPAPGLATTPFLILATIAAPLAALRTLPIPTALLCLGLAAIPLATTLLWAAQRAPRDPGVAGLLTGFLTSLVLMTAISLAAPVMIERTLLFTLVFFLPLLAGTLAAAPPARRAVLLAALLLAQCPGFTPLFAPLRHDEDWPALATAAAAESRATGWPILVLGGFEALTLHREHPTLAPTVLIPPLGARLNRRVAQDMLAAPTLELHEDPCPRLGHPGGVLLVTRQNVAMDALHPAISALLETAGATPAATTGFGSLSLQRWPGLCAPPAPAAAP